MSLIANWSYPTSIRFGAGRIVEIADACKTIGITKPLLVTDRGLAKLDICLLYTSPSPRDTERSRMPSSA